MRLLAQNPPLLVVKILRVILLLLLLDNHVVTGFHIIQQPLHCKNCHQRRLYFSSLNNNDYEYIPKENAKTSRDSVVGAADSSALLLLTSAYPPSTPSGLRGEAVRSALKSSRCIAWSFSSQSNDSNDNYDDKQHHRRHPLASGLLRVSGTGCVNFLNNKLSQSFANDNNNNSKKKKSSYFKQGALLTSKGAIVDQLGVAVVSPAGDESFIWTSPGHDSQDLFQRLNKYIFPLDKVALQDCCSKEDNKDNTSKNDSGSVMLESCFTLASLQLEHVQDVFDKWIQPKLKNVDERIQLPQHDECRLVKLYDVDDSDSSSSLLILPTVSLNPCAAVGCTFLFLVSNKDKKSKNSNLLGQEIWSALVDDSNREGPIAIGSLEWETLRIEAGVPRFGYEMTAATVKTSSSNDSTTTPITDATSTTPAAAKPAMPLELHLQHLIDLEKGCYMGQEGVASVIKNLRGPPRNLYQIEWHDEFNLYDYQSTFDDGDDKRKENDNETRIPRCGDVLYVLGSNQQIPVGTVTSVAEPGGTGEAVTLGLALIRRADGIITKMEKLDLEMQKQPSSSSSFLDDQPSSSSSPAAAAAVLKLDPLDGLEVIIGDSYTIGTLRTVPSRRGPNYHLFHDDTYQDKSARITDISVPGVAAKVQLYEPASSISSVKTTRASSSTSESPPPAEEESSAMSTVPDTEDESNDQEEIEFLLKQAVEEASQAQAKAEASTAGAKRKAEKMKLLQERADQAMAARRKNSASSGGGGGGG